MVIDNGKIVEIQMKRKLKGTFKVFKKCSYGYPMVIISDPVMNGKPFPTIFWLTCPYLRKKVSELESMGYIGKIEDIIDKNSIVKERYMKAHEKIIQIRFDILKRKYPQYLKNRRFVCALKKGIGGLEDLKRVKCLHLHVAHYIAGIDDPVGELIFNTLERTECEEVLCEMLLRKEK